MIKTYHDAVVEIYLSAKDKDCKLTRDYLIEICKSAMIRDGHMYVGMTDRDFIESLLQIIKDDIKTAEKETNPEELCKFHKLALAILEKNIQTFLHEKSVEEEGILEEFTEL